MKRRKRDEVGMACLAIRTWGEKGEKDFIKEEEGKLFLTSCGGERERRRRRERERGVRIELIGLVKKAQEDQNSIPNLHQVS